MDALRLSRAEQNVVLLRAMLGEEAAGQVAEAVEGLARAHPTPDELALLCCLAEVKALHAGMAEGDAARWKAIREVPEWAPPAPRSRASSPSAIRPPALDANLSASNKKHKQAKEQDMDNRDANRDRIAKALRNEGAATYAELQARSHVVAGSFGRVLSRMCEEGSVTKSDSGDYHLTDSDTPAGDSGDHVPDLDLHDGGDRDDPAQARKPFTYGTQNTINYLCFECGTGHPVPEKTAGESHRMMHERHVAAAQVSR